MLDILNTYFGFQVTPEVALPIISYILCVSFVVLVDLVYRVFKHCWR